MRLAPLLLLLVLGCQDNASQVPTVNLQPAFQMFGSGDAEGALAMLDSLEAANPESAQVLAARGQFLRQMQELEGSLAAYEGAVDLNPSAPGTLFNLGIAHALVGQDDDAMDALLRARDAGFNVLNIHNSPVAGRLAERDDFAALFPAPGDYADPFVEGTEIIHDWTGENARDQFGWIARNVRDVDGDGVDDAVSSAPTNSDGAPSGGKIYVYSGRSGDLLWTAVGQDAQGQLGFGVEAAGDVNGDGTPDVIAGAPYANVAMVYSGVDGSVIHRIEGSDPAGAFGATVRGIGDVNDDGFGDLLIGEPHQVWGGPIGGGTLDHPGAAHIVSGRDASTLATRVGANPGDGFGSTLAGTLDGGNSPYVVGAPSAGSENRGRAYVYRGLAPEAEHEFAPSATGVNLGAMFMSVMGDANGDGVQDFYISDWADAAKGPSTGRIYVFSGADGSTLAEIGGENAGDGFGIGVSDAGDIDGDGLADLIIGAWQYAGEAASGGKLYAYTGQGTLLHTVTGKVMGETLGFDTTGLGDVNGDGVVDFLVTSAWSGINGFQSGRTLVISGQNPN
ncbi:MAG: hypothetical protein HKN29_12285 [Rhodothermales bacterium]|nr:hypothetical protein [Rhodothermales bacterium]